LEPAADESIAVSVLPPPLWRAIRAVFEGGAPGIALVGGTALAGFFAGHRRSDDIDLFTADNVAQRMAVAAVKGLAAIGAKLADERSSPGFYHALVDLDGHAFTAQAVLDANVHRVGTFLSTPSGIRVASTTSLLKMKVATLVSRCSEKDLYDLLWLKEHGPWPDLATRLELGREIEGGVDAEGMLACLTMAKPNVGSCAFAESQGVPAPAVLSRIEALRGELETELVEHLEHGGATDPRIAPLLRKLRRKR
jgi:hypothetical protein